MSYVRPSPKKALDLAKRRNEGDIKTMSRPTLEQFKKKALADRGVIAEYEALAPAFEMKRRMIAMRKGKA